MQQAVRAADAAGRRRRAPVISGFSDPPRGAVTFDRMSVREDSSRRSFTGNRERQRGGTLALGARRQAKRDSR